MKNKSYKVYREVELGTYHIPVEALRLTEDIATLETILTLFEKLSARSFAELKTTYTKPGFTKAMSENHKLMRKAGFILASMKRIAEQNLAHDFLTGEPPPRKRRRRQTLADVWRILNEETK